MRHPIDRQKQHRKELVAFDLQSARGPTLAEPLPDAEKAIALYSSIQILSHQESRPLSFLNRTSWRPQDKPLLSVERKDWDEHQLVAWTGAEPAWVDVAINNLDATGHSFHLHGHDFYVLARHRGRGGWDYFNPFTSDPPVGASLNVLNPPLKDTVFVPASGYAVLRFRADNPGIWALHCHLLWHAGSGMAMAIQALGDEYLAFAGTATAAATEISCSM
jgi:hypothetical protein